jgi:hypothetical protein
MRPGAAQSSDEQDDGPQQEAINLAFAELEIGWHASLLRLLVGVEVVVEAEAKFEKGTLELLGQRRI